MNRDKDILSNGDALIEFVQQVTQSEQYQRERQALIDGPHPPPDLLFDLSLGSTSELTAQEQAKWDRHIALCPVCSQQAFEIRKLNREFLGIKETEENAVAIWTDDVGSLREYGKQIWMPTQSFAVRSSLISLPTPDPVPRPEKWYLRPPYTSLRDQLIETTRFAPGESVVLMVNGQADGYLSVFLQGEAGDLSLAYPRCAEDDTGISVEPAKAVRFRAPTEPGRFNAMMVWTRNKIFDPYVIDFPYIEDDEVVQAFAKDLTTGQVAPDDWGVSICSLMVAKVPALSLEDPLLTETEKIVGIRTVDIGAKDREYWVPLIFDEIRRNRHARFAWSNFDGANLFRLRMKVRDGVKLTPDEEDAWKHAEFLWALASGDQLIYINVPEDDVCTVVDVIESYEFTEIWDPARKGDFRHSIRCDYVGTFHRDCSDIHPELSKRLKLRGSHWDLTRLKALFRRIDARLRHPAPGYS